jgi:hypothetical protein
MENVDSFVLGFLVGGLTFMVGWIIWAARDD